MGVYNIICKNKLLLPEIIVEPRGVKSNYFVQDLVIIVNNAVESKGVLT